MYLPSEPSGPLALVNLVVSTIAAACEAISASQMCILSIFVLKKNVVQNLIIKFLYLIISFLLNMRYF